MRKSLLRVGVVVLTFAGAGVFGMASSAASALAVTNGAVTVRADSAQDPIWGGISVDSGGAIGMQDPIWG